MLVTTTETVAGTTATIMGRIQGLNGDLTAGATSTVKLRVIDEDNPSVLVLPELDITPGDVLAALSTDHPWGTHDADGYNFRYEVLSTEIPLPLKTYIFQFKFTFASDEPIIQTAKITTLLNLFQVGV